MEIFPVTTTTTTSGTTTATQSHNDSPTKETAKVGGTPLRAVSTTSCDVDGNQNVETRSQKFGASTALFPGSKVLSQDLANKLHSMVVQAEREKGQKLQFPHWRLLWRGTDDGFEAVTFHRLCDNQGPTISVIRTHSRVDYIFGGYTPLQFQSTTFGYRGGCSGRTFVYSLVRAGAPTGLILRCMDHEHCIFDYPSRGPVYGGGCCLHIADLCNESTGNYSNTSAPKGLYCEAPPLNLDGGDDSTAYLTGDFGGWLVAEIEVWCNSTDLL
ncbi:hypothetical protein Pelo_17057 [Pelomyxa schiedti]|nr:hypothetical protein Pelo_17057 [Pelomyxa schiedti]